jgi:hypothetical protein
MKSYSVLGCLVLMLVLINAPAVDAALFTVTISENGILTFSGNGMTSTRKAHLDPDPTPGEDATIKVPTFGPVGGTVVAGDWILFEDEDKKVKSDVIRFPDNGGGKATKVLFYSDKDKESPGAFDVGLPATTIKPPDPLEFVEGPLNGSKAKGIEYKPTEGQPGFLMSDNDSVQYIIISDPVPEPASLSLIVIGTVILLSRWMKVLS